MIVQSQIPQAQTDEYLRGILACEHLSTGPQCEPGDGEDTGSGMEVV